MKRVRYEKGIKGLFGKSVARDPAIVDGLRQVEAELSAFAAELMGRRPEVEWKSGLIVHVFPKRDHLLGAHVDCVDFGFWIELVAGGFDADLGDAPYYVVPHVYDMSDDGYGSIRELSPVGYPDAPQAIEGLRQAVGELRSLATDIAPTAAAWRAALPEPPAAMPEADSSGQGP